MADLFGQEKPIAPRELLAVYDQLHREYCDGIPAPIVGKKDAPLAARLLKMYSFDQLKSWLRLYFIVPDQFIQKGGYTFGVFSSCIGKIIQYDRRVAARPAPVVRHQPSAEFRALQQQIRSEWGS